MPAAVRASAIEFWIRPDYRRDEVTRYQPSVSVALRPDRSEYWRTLDQFAEIQQRLGRLSSLGENWDSYGAEPPNERAIDLTKDFLGKLREEFVVPARVVASVEGGVGICFVRDGKYADIECFNDGEIVGVFYRNEDPPQVFEATSDEAGVREAISRVVAFIHA